MKFIKDQKPANRAHVVRLRILTLNVWDTPNAKDRKARMRAIGQTLAALDVDVIALQEVWFQSDRKSLSALLSQAGMYSIHSFPDDGFFSSGLVVFSRWSVIQAGFTPFHPNGDPKKLTEADYYGRKGLGFVRLDTPVGPVDLYNLHTIAQYHPDEKDVYRGQRAAQIYQVLRTIEMKSGSNPVFVTGDLNASPSQFGYKLLTSSGSFQDAFGDLYPFANSATYSSENPYIQQSPGRQDVAERLDYIFYRSGQAVQITPLQGEMLCFPNLERCEPVCPPALSDHFGILVSFEVIRRKNSAKDTQAPTGLHWDIKNLERLSHDLADGAAYAMERRRRSVLEIRASLLILALLTSIGKITRFSRRVRLFNWIAGSLVAFLLVNLASLSEVTSNELPVYNQIMDEIHQYHGGR